MKRERSPHRIAHWVMNEKERFVRVDDVATREIAGETIIVPIRSGVADLECVFTLNEVGSRIWDALDHPLTPDEVAARIAAEFEVSETAAKSDVADYFENLRDAGLIKRMA